MDYEGDFEDHATPSFDPMKNVGVDVEAKGFNPGLIVLLLVGGLVLAFLIGNYILYMYAQKTLPPKKKEASLQEEDEEGETEARRFSTRRIGILNYLG